MPLSKLLPRRATSIAPAGYVTPAFPGLNLHFASVTDSPYRLFYSSDMWRFTLYWTLIMYAAIHIATSFYACVIQWRNWKVIWITPFLFLLVGGLEALIAGSVVGGL